MDTWTVATLDVWGNEKDGWDVNNVYKYCDDLVIADDADEHDIMQALKRMGLLKKACQLRWLDIDWCDDTMIEINQAKNGYPLFQITRNL